MSSASETVAAILLIAVPTVELGGLSLLRMLVSRIPGYLDNPLRQNLFRAGHVVAFVAGRRSASPTGLERHFRDHRWTVDTEHSGASGR